MNKNTEKLSIEWFWFGIKGKIEPKTQAKNMQASFESIFNKNLKFHF